MILEFVNPPFLVVCCLGGGGHVFKKRISELDRRKGLDLFHVGVGELAIPGEVLVHFRVHGFERVFGIGFEVTRAEQGCSLEFDNDHQPKISGRSTVTPRMVNPGREDEPASKRNAKVLAFGRKRVIPNTDNASLFTEGNVYNPLMLLPRKICYLHRRGGTGGPLGWS
jgi:hypothetical protein